MVLNQFTTESLKRYHYTSFGKMLRTSVGFICTFRGLALSERRVRRLSFIYIITEKGFSEKLFALLYYCIVLCLLFGFLHLFSHIFLSQFISLVSLVSILFQSSFSVLHPSLSTALTQRIHVLFMFTNS